MKCPFCGSDDDRVVDTRPHFDGSAIRRRRLCNKCGKRFITIEEVEDKTLYVIKADGRRESFNRDKLRKGIEIACIKRPVSIDQIDKIVSKIEAEIKADFVKEIDSLKIGELVSKLLKELDEVAYVRFASVYRKFKDKEEFLRELNQLIE